MTRIEIPTGIPLFPGEAPNEIFVMNEFAVIRTHWGCCVHIQQMSVKHNSLAMKIIEIRT